VVVGYLPHRLTVDDVIAFERFIKMAHAWRLRGGPLQTRCGRSASAIVFPWLCDSSLCAECVQLEPIVPLSSPLHPLQLTDFTLPEGFQIASGAVVPRLRACRKPQRPQPWMQAGKTVEATLPANLNVYHLLTRTVPFCTVPGFQTRLWARD
jgi:hypothetical protein